MTTTKSFLLVFLLVYLGLTTSSTAATLNVGDPAPKLEVGKWVQGDPVTKFERDKVYLVEFWATWCGPCRTSIPHLNELHKKYQDKGFVVIGQDCWERDEQLVPRFIKQMGEKMTYRVALDDKTEVEKGKMAVNWMDAAERRGIPSAFLVDKTGAIAWIGHPMDLEEPLIEEILAGKHDLKKRSADYIAAKEKETKTARLWQAYNKASDAKDYKTADKALNDLEAAGEPKEIVDFDRLMVRLAVGDNAGAEKLAASLAETRPNNFSFHNQLAWSIITSDNPSKTLLSIAEKEANRANALAKEKDAATLDTVARVKFVLGDKQAAIAMQQKAIEAAASDGQKSQFQKVLDSYKAGKLPD